MTAALPEKIYTEFAALCQEGEAATDAGDFNLALQKYGAAINVLPDPPIQWEEAAWLYMALGDLLFSYGYDKDALPVYQCAVKCPEALGNPYIHLRLGQVQFELGDMDRAADELTRAYMGGDLEIFMEDDPKYLEFLKTKIKI